LLANATYGGIHGNESSGRSPDRTPRTTAYNNEWLVRFLKQFNNEAVFLSQHYYAEGPPTDPSMTIERLLRPKPKLQEEFEGTRATIEESATALPAGGNEFVLPRVASKG
jgi:hypothetical protein